MVGSDSDGVQFVPENGQDSSMRRQACSMLVIDDSPGKKKIARQLKKHVSATSIASSEPNQKPVAVAAPTNVIGESSESDSSLHIPPTPARSGEAKAKALLNAQLRKAKSKKKGKKETRIVF